MMTPRFRLPRLLTLVFGACVLTAATAQLASASPGVRTPGGTTVVTLSPVFVGAAQTLGVGLAPLSPSFVDETGAAVTFPISGGIVDAQNAVGQIVHRGGLIVTLGATQVVLSDFVIDTTRLLTSSAPQLTGLVTVNGNVAGRLALFDLQLPPLTLPLTITPGTPEEGGPRLVVPGVGVTLTSDAAAALNQAFNVSAFARGLTIGTARVTVQTPRVLP